MKMHLPRIAMGIKPLTGLVQTKCGSDVKKIDSPEEVIAKLGDTEALSTSWRFASIQPSPCAAM